MIVPKRFVQPGMTKEQKKKTGAWIKSKRKEMAAEPTFETQEEAVQAAAEIQRREQSLPTVWKEPQDIGNKYVVVHSENKENAYISGYTQVVGEQEIFDKARESTRKSIDEIEEV